jgi:hypothetical protein
MFVEFDIDERSLLWFQRQAREGKIAATAGSFGVRFMPTVITSLFAIRGRLPNPLRNGNEASLPVLAR